MKQPLLIPILVRGLERYQNFEGYRYELLGITETVPEGMIVDGASVPRIAWWFMPPDGLHRAAALPHDDIYGRRGRMPSGRKIKRIEADKLLYSRMREAGCHRFRCEVVYYAVRAFGWYAWMTSKGQPQVLPVINAAPTICPKVKKNPFQRHIYATVLTP